MTWLEALAEQRALILADQGFKDEVADGMQSNLDAHGDDLGPTDPFDGLPPWDDPVYDELANEHDARLWRHDARA
jgi:hypothetical protein